MRLFTIGFTKKPAERFFTLLISAGVRTLIDVRLHNNSQLAGFSKRDDLAYFLRAIAKIEYRHLPLLAPTADMLEDYKQRGGSWNDYAPRFQALLDERQIETQLSPVDFDQACLLCSEHDAAGCHRRLVAEHLARHWGNVEIVHLK